MVNLDGEVHVLNSFLSIPVVPYATKLGLMVFDGDLPLEVTPPITEIPVASLAVQHDVSSVMREDHMVHVKGIPPLDWQTMTCKRAGRK